MKPFSLYQCSRQKIGGEIVIQAKFISWSSFVFTYYIPHSVDKVLSKDIMLSFFVLFNYRG